MNPYRLVYALIIVGLCYYLRGRVPYIGMLPGDFYFYTGRFEVFLPLTSSILLHVLFSLARGFIK